MLKCPSLCPPFSLKADEEARADGFQSDETVPETETPVSNVFFFLAPCPLNVWRISREMYTLNHVFLFLQGNWNQPVQRGSQETLRQNESSSWYRRTAEEEDEEGRGWLQLAVATNELCKTEAPPRTWTQHKHMNMKWLCGENPTPHPDTSYYVTLPDCWLKDASDWT